MSEAGSAFTQTHDDKTVRIDFRPAPSGQWPVELVADWPHPFTSQEVDRVVLSGRGAVWMYAAAAACCRGIPLEVAFADSSKLTIPVAVAASSSAAARAGSVVQFERFMPPSERSPRCLVRLNPQRGKLPPTSSVAAALRRWTSREAAAAEPSRLILTGRAPVWAYAAAGAADGGASRIDCFLPRSGLIRCDSAGREIAGKAERFPDWLLDQLRPANRDGRKPGRLIGVVGDPNSGKSVLVSLLDRAVDHRYEHDGWIYDCDAASPTPPWYLDLVRTGRGAEAARLRGQAKQPWSAEMEELIAADLRRLRRCMQFVVADLPGGDHRSEPPQRIPPGRELIMRKIDAFLILSKSSEIEANWRQALAAHGLAGRVAAVIESSAPEAATSLVRVGPGRWRAEGLRRETALQRDDAVAQAAAEVLEWLSGCGSGRCESDSRPEPEH